MKKRNLLFAFAFSLPVMGISQKTEKTPVSNYERVAIKWAPVGLVAGKVSMFGEYNFKKNQSIGLGVGIPASTTYNIKLDAENSPISVETFSITPSYRFYLGKKPMSGIYIEPFLNYVDFKASGSNISGTISTQEVEYVVSADHKSYGGGLQFGVQFAIAKKIVFDLFLIGGEANSADMSLRFREVTNVLPWTNAQASEVEADIKDALSKIPFIGDRINVTVDQANRTVTGDYKGFLPWVRTGASVGIKF